MNKNLESNLSILQRNYLKMFPVIQELHKCLAREEGEKDPTDVNLLMITSDNEEVDKKTEEAGEILQNSSIFNEDKENTQNTERPAIHKIGKITILKKMKRDNKID